jgi:riboflavin kinase/FMN adenylyltransferase
MLKTVFLTKNYKEKSPCVILLGGFDGAHLGHRSLVERAKEYGLPIGIMTIVGGKGEYVFTPQERLALFSDLGIDFVLEFRFEEICGYSPREFVEIITDRFSVQAFLCGEDFRFGFRAS